MSFIRTPIVAPFRFRDFRKTTADSILRNTIGRALVGKGWYGDRVIAVERRVYDNLLRDHVKTHGRRVF